jgi:Cu/Ag efflux protein CusF
MSKMFLRCGYTTAAFLALTIGANAMNATGLGNFPAARGNSPLWMVQAQQSNPAKIFRATGIVSAVKPAGTLTINHEAIEGLMPAMEMTFSVNPGTLANGVRPGDKVDFSVDGKTFTVVSLKVTGHTR